VADFDRESILALDNIRLELPVANIGSRCLAGAIDGCAVTVLLGLWLLLCSVLAFWVTIFMPAASFYTNQESFRAVVGASTLIVIGSLAGFVAGQTLNAWVVVAIKARTKERHLWARLIGSTIVSEFADTLVFCSFAAWAIGINTLRDFLIYVIWGWFYKSAVEAAVMPITYRVIAHIKRREPTYQPAV